MRHRPLVLLLGAVLQLHARRASASPPESSTAPPSPANGERLDGRAAPDSHQTAMVVPRALLWVPRAVFTVVAVPVAWGAEEAEEHHLFTHLYWALTSDDERTGIRPEFRFESGSYISGGFRLFSHGVFGPDSLFQMRARTGGRDILFGSLSIEVDGFSWVAEGERRNDATFAGTEGQTKDELAEEGFAVTRFGFDRAATSLSYLRPVAPPLSLQASVGVAAWRFNDGVPRGGNPTIDEVWCFDCATGVVSNVLVPGFNEGTRRVRTEAAVTFDTRLHPRYGSGVAARIAGAWAHGIAGDQSHDVGASVDVAGAFDLGDRAVGLRLRAAVIEPLGDVPVPFIALVGASGRQGIRALRTGRLRGNSAFVGTVFYRYLLTPNADFMLFADYGGAFGSWFDNFTADHLIDGYGVSLWLYKAKGRYFEGDFLARIEAAWAPGEGSRIVVVTDLD